MRTLFTLLCLGSMAVAAQVPQKLGYQGRLLKADGNPETGVVTIVYSVWDAETSGTKLWNESQQLALADGFYSTYLGSVTPIPSTVFTGPERWLELEVSGTALSPRQKIASVAYALTAGAARDVTGGTVDATSVRIGGNTVIDAQGRLVGTAAPYTPGPGLQLTGNSLSVITSCSMGQYLQWNGTAWVCGAQSASGVTSVTASGPLMSSGGATPDISLGIVPVANGGTGVATAGAARTALGAAQSGANADITSLSGLTTALSLAQGGTASNSSTGARLNLGAAQSGANADITSLAALSTPLSVGQGGTGASTVAGARAAMGAAASGANADITSLSSLLTPLSIAQGGTGSATQSWVDLSTNQSIAGTKTFLTAIAVRNGALGSTIVPTGLSASRTFTLPDVNGVAITTGNMSAITATGTVGSGVWNATPIGAASGGTGLDTSAAGAGALLRRNGAGNAWEVVAGGASGQVLSMVGGVPSWGFAMPLVQLPRANVISSVGFGSTSQTSMTIGADAYPVISSFGFGTLIITKCTNTTCSATPLTVFPDAATNVGIFNSIILGADGLPVVAYNDATNGDLKVLKCGTASCSSGNTISVVDANGVAGQYNSIAIGTDGNPIISYYEAGAADLMVAKCTNPACTAATLTNADSAGAVGQYTSIAVGPGNAAAISYWDATNNALKLVRCTNACTSPTPITVDTGGGTNTSVAFGNDGFVVIAFQGGFSTLRVYKCYDFGCTAPTATVLENFTGGELSLTIGTDGNPVVSARRGDNSLGVFKCGDAACAAGAGLVVLDAPNPTRHSSITLGADGNPVISYKIDGTGELKVAACAAPHCGSNVTRR